ncbi:MAG: hypothetical protein ABIF09_12610 [Gemmatimonadota bacterium]
MASSLPLPDGRNRLDEEVAVRLLGYRWVRWGTQPPYDEEGRFLAPPDGFLAHHQVVAGPEVPLADEPFRYVPGFSSEVEPAFEAARSVGLFHEANAFLMVSDTGEWSVRTEDERLNVMGATLPEALCRAALRWRELQETPAPPAPVG